ncbi:hypothetical protein [Metallosphaera hakonensis]
MADEAVYFFDECRAVISTLVKRVLARRGSKPVLRVNTSISGKL